jgi:hypothetical protein
MKVWDCPVMDSKLKKNIHHGESSGEGSYTGSISDEELLAWDDTRDTEEDAHKVKSVNRPGSCQDRNSLVEPSCRLIWIRCEMHLQEASWP